MNEQKMTHIWCILRVLMNILLHLNFLNFNINLQILFPNTQKDLYVLVHVLERILDNL